MWADNVNILCLTAAVLFFGSGGALLAMLYTPFTIITRIWKNSTKVLRKKWFYVKIHNFKEKTIEARDRRNRHDDSEQEPIKSCIYLIK